MYGGTSLLHPHSVHALVHTHSSKGILMSHNMLCKIGSKIGSMAMLSPLA